MAIVLIAIACEPPSLLLRGFDDSNNARLIALAGPT